MKSKDIVVFHPDIYKTETDNEYTKNICNVIKSRYDIKSVMWFIKHPFDSRVRCLYLNWYENTKTEKSFLVQWISYQIKLIALRIAHIRKIRVVYVVHNKIPHALNKNSKIYRRCTKPFMKKALRLSNTVVGLCNETEQYLKVEYEIKDIAKKMYILPHGKYKKYECNLNKIRKRYGISDKELLLTSVGRMDKYKNIDVIIRAFYKANIKGKLLLVGKCDEEYKSHIEKLIKESSVICDFRFVSDEDMSGIMQTADAVLLPYTYTSLNSGIMINAFSNGTTVIGTNIGMLKDYPAELVYGYDYSDKKEHVEALSNAMKCAAADFEAGTLKKKGKKLQEKMDKENDWDMVGDMLMNIL